jgi:hypothetical protein
MGANLNRRTAIMRPFRCPTPLLPGLVFAIVFVIACSTSGPRQTRLMKTSKMTISAAQLRVEVRSLADRFSGLMEGAGNAVLASTDDPEMKRRALLWLTNGVPAMQQALFEPDPLAALVEAQFLIAQLRRYFDGPTEIPIPEAYLQIVTSALDAMEADMKLIVDNAGEKTDYAAGRQLIYDTAAQYPITSGFVSRQGSVAMLAEFTARAGGGALKSIGSITETVADLVARIDLNAEYIPKFARWQAQLLIMDEVKGDEDYQSVISSIEQLQHLELVAAFLEDLDPLIADLPDLVADEREAVLDAVHGFLLETFAFAESQRTTLMHEDVRTEREAILTAVREERMVVLAAIAEERRLVLEAVSRERAAVFTDLDALVDEAFTREVNKLFIRGLILIAIILGGFATITFLGVRALKRERGN